MANHIPAYRLHKGTGYAYVCHRSIPGKSHRMYIGKHGTPESLHRYREFLERVAADRAGYELPALGALPTVAELALRYREYAKVYYQRPDGLSPQYHCMRVAVRRLVGMFGSEAAKDFGPKKLRLLRDAMIRAGLSRGYINQNVDRVKRLYRWASAEELVPPATWHGLACVRNLRQDELGARETAAVVPADLDGVMALLPFLSPTVAALIQTQYLCCMRPGEACRMRPRNIDRSGEIWLYRPETHKTQRKGKTLVKAIPKACQRILAPLLLGRPDDAYIFSPRESVAHSLKLKAESRPARKTPRYPSEEKRVDREKQNAARRRTKGVGCYSRATYRQAIQHGIDKAAKAGVTIQPFRPNQLRHAMVTYVSRTLGAQAAQRFAGHASLQTTNIYTQIEVAELVAIARQLDSARSS